MNITLMAHDKKKELMVQFCTAYKSVLSKHNLSATATTGRLVAEATGLPVLFTDPNNSDPWEDQQVVQTLHLCDAHNVPMATNLATAEMLILGLQRGDLDWREMIRRKRSVR